MHSLIQQAKLLQEKPAAVETLKNRTECCCYYYYYLYLYDTAYSYKTIKELFIRNLPEQIFISWYR